MAFRATSGPTTVFPFVSNPIPSWPVQPVVTNTEDGAYIMKPGENAHDVLSSNRVVYLMPGETYYWKNVLITSSLILRGQGANVFLDGVGPILMLEGGSQPSDLNVTIDGVNFMGGIDVPDRGEPMSALFLDQGAIWAHNAFKTSIVNCSFQNFKGCAVWFYDDREYWTNRTWSQQHIVSFNRFQGCRMGVANGGGSEYAFASCNCFFDCQICFYVIGGNWNRSSNLIVNCRCAYYHSKDGMWYTGSGNYNPAHGSFTGNTLNHCDYGGNLWPTAFIGADGRSMNLAGMYFDNDSAYPPTWTGNTQYYGDMYVNKYSNKQKAWCIVGCTIMGGSGADPSVGKITIGSSVTNTTYFIGCSGNSVYVYGAKAANMTPATFASIQNNP